MKLLVGRPARSRQSVVREALRLGKSLEGWIDRFSVGFCKLYAGSLAGETPPSSLHFWFFWRLVSRTAQAAMPVWWLADFVACDGIVASPFAALAALLPLNFWHLKHRFFLI